MYWCIQQNTQTQSTPDTSKYTSTWCNQNQTSSEDCVAVALQVFVLSVTMVREAVDEVRRFQRDKEMNGQLYDKLTVRGEGPARSHTPSQQEEPLGWGGGVSVAGPWGPLPPLWVPHTSAELELCFSPAEAMLVCDWPT